MVGEGDPLSVATGIDIVRACFIEDDQAMYIYIEVGNVLFVVELRCLWYDIKSSKHASASSRGSTT